MAYFTDISLGYLLAHESVMTDYQGRGVLPEDMFLTSRHSLQVSETRANLWDPKALTPFPPTYPLPSDFGRIHALSPGSLW